MWGVELLEISIHLSSTLAIDLGLDGSYKRTWTYFGISMYIDYSTC